MIPTPFGALTKNVFAIVEENGVKLPFHTNVSSVSADAFCPAAKELLPFIILLSPHGITLPHPLRLLKPHHPIELLLPYSIVLNCPPPMKFLLPAHVIVLLVPHAIVLPSPSAVILLLLPHPIVKSVPSAILLTPQAIVLRIHIALLCEPPAIVFGYSIVAGHHDIMVLSCHPQINEAGALSTILLNPPQILV